MQCLITLLLIMVCYIHIVQSLNTLNTTNTNTTTVSSLPIKRILMIIFPGGRSHNWVLKSLFDYTKAHEDKFQYEYHIIIHNIDIDTWSDRNGNGTNGFFFYGYGNKSIYHKVFGAALEMINHSPTFGFLNFHVAMKFNYREFMDSDILTRLLTLKSNQGITFDMIASDVPNYIYVLLERELGIPSKIYLSPPAIPQLDFEDFELNPSYTPAIGSKSSDMMTFSERLVNYATLTGTRLMFKLFVRQQAKVFKDYGYTLNRSVYYPEAVHIYQYPLGLAFPLSLPPNFVMLNAITPKPARPINETNEDIDVFLNRHKHNVYLSQGTIVKILDLQGMIDIFKYFEERDTGFIVSWRDALLSQKDKLRIPSNVLMVNWVNQNDLLGDDRLSCFITHGGINSVAESIYHYKPMVVLGVSLDQLNTAAFARKANVGVVIQDKEQLTQQRLIEAIRNVLDKEEYKDSVRRLGELFRDSRDAHVEFKYWIDFGLKHTFKSLFIDMYIEGNWWSINGFDVFGVVMGIGLGVIVLIGWIVRKVAVICWRKVRGKHKKIKDYSPVKHE